MDEKIKSLYIKTSRFCIFSKKNIEELDSIIKSLYGQNAYKYIACVVNTESIAGVIYCVHNNMYNYYGINVYKIGRTNDFLKREKQYTTPYIEISTVKYIVKVYDNIIAEKLIFKRLNNFRIVKNREFFNCEFDIIKQTMDNVQDLINNHYEDALAENMETIIKTHIEQSPAIRRRKSCIDIETDSKILENICTKKRSDSVPVINFM